MSPLTSPEITPEPVCADIAGIVLEVAVAVGDTVADGDVVALLESMKMEIPIVAEVDGVVASVAVSVGSAVGLADVVATVARRRVP